MACYEIIVLSDLWVYYFFLKFTLFKSRGKLNKLYIYNTNSVVFIILIGLTSKTIAVLKHVLNNTIKSYSHPTAY